MYIVMEIQKDENGAIATLVNSATEYEEALSRYFTVSAAAAVSQVPLHSVVLLTEAGGMLRNESFRHDTHHEETPETE